MLSKPANFVRNVVSHTPVSADLKYVRKLPQLEKRSCIRHISGHPAFIDLIATGVTHCQALAQFPIQAGLSRSLITGNRGGFDEGLYIF